MRASIAGFRYDTDKAELIGNHEHGTLVNDFSYWEASLYKTPRVGQYFLAGRGGPMTRFARRIDNHTVGFGERIIPISESDALDWIDQYLN